MRLAAQGNRSAFAAIYERHSESLLCYCQSITGDRDSASDALQATMVKALVAIKGDAPGSRPRMLRAWLFRIAHNESVSILRQRRPGAAVEVLPELVAATASPEARSRLTELLSDLGQLSERRRSALLMRELCGLSYMEISSALDCSEAAARQSVFEARGALFDLAEGRQTSCDTIRGKIADGDGRLLRA